VPLEVRYGLDQDPEWSLVIDIEPMLDPIPGREPEATNRPVVDWWGFYKDTREHDLKTVLKRLPSHIDIDPGREDNHKLDATRRTRGPKPDMTRHQKIASVIDRFGADWREEENLAEICERLDVAHIRVSPNWHPWAQSWVRAATKKKHDVIKALQYSLDKAG